MTRVDRCSRKRTRGTTATVGWDLHLNDIRVYIADVLSPVSPLPHVTQTLTSLLNDPCGTWLT